MAKSKRRSKPKADKGWAQATTHKFLGIEYCQVPAKVLKKVLEGVRPYIGPRIDKNLWPNSNEGLENFAAEMRRAFSTHREVPLTDPIMFEFDALVGVGRPGEPALILYVPTVTGEDEALKFLRVITTGRVNRSRGVPSLIMMEKTNAHGEQTLLQFLYDSLGNVLNVLATPFTRNEQGLPVFTAEPKSIIEEQHAPDSEARA